jgi:predicted outer membrane repeat protein
MKFNKKVISIMAWCIVISCAANPNPNKWINVATEYAVQSAINSAEEGDVIGFDVKSDLVYVTKGIKIDKNITLYGYNMATKNTITFRVPKSRAKDQENCRVFQIGNNSKVTLDSINIKGGYLNGDNLYGAAVENYGDLTLSNCNLTNNNGFGIGNCGGAVANFNDLHMYDCKLLNNTSTYCGGGIYNGKHGDLFMRNTYINNNSVTDPEECYGGGIYNNYLGSINIISCTIRENQAGEGNAKGYGGGIANKSYGIFRDTKIQKNTSSTAGGGIYAKGGDLCFSKSCIIEENSSLNGGGIFQESFFSDMLGYWVFGKIKFTDKNKINNNRALKDGGGIYCSNIFFTVQKSSADGAISLTTITGNKAGSNGGGIYFSEGDCFPKEFTDEHGINDINWDIGNSPDNLLLKSEEDSNSMTNI